MISLWKSITSNSLTLLIVAWTNIHLYLCVACNAERSSIKASRRWLKTIQLETGASGWTQQQELLQRQRGKSPFFPLQERFWGCESTFWGESVSMQPPCLCRRNLGSLKWVLVTEKGTHYHFCIVSSFHSSSGFVSTKSAKAVFFCCPILNSWSCLWFDQVKKLLKANVLTPHHTEVGATKIQLITFVSCQAHKHWVWHHKHPSFSVCAGTQHLVDQKKEPFLSQTLSNTNERITPSLQGYSDSQKEQTDRGVGETRMERSVTGEEKEARRQKLMSKKCEENRQHLKQKAVQMSGNEVKRWGLDSWS